MKLYTMFDLCTSEYGDVMSFVNDESATRWFKNFLNGLPISYRTDYSLIFVGSFSAGKLTPMEHKLVFNGKDFSDFEGKVNNV